MTVIFFHAGVPGTGGGFLAVDVFFVLSGFVITRLLADEIRDTGQVQVLPFYVRRFARLMPAYALMLAAYVVIAPLAWPGLEHARGALIAGTYMSDYALAFDWMSGRLGHTWSLSVEEHFYLIWPLLLPLIIRRPWLLLLLYVELTLWRYSLPFDHGYNRFDAHCTGMILGAIAAIWQPRVPPAFAFVAVVGLGLLVFFGRLTSPAASTWLITAGEFVSVVLILALRTDGPIAKLLSATPMVWLGGISYSVYLWHYPITVWLRSHYSWPMTVMTASILCIALATLSGRYVERPARQWGASVADRLRSRAQAYA